MSIRTRLTLWYTGMLFVSMLAIGASAYHEFVVERGGVIGDGEPVESTLYELCEMIGIWFGLPAAILGLAGGWILTRKALAPVAALTAAASRVNEHHLRESLPRTGNGDELDRLTEVFNDMTARLAGSFQRIREFTLHASHELKTPLTVLHGELEAALQDGGLSAEHRERCATQLDEVQRLAIIVDGLTLLTRAGAGEVRLAREPVRLDELVHDAFADAQILAQPRNLEVSLDPCEPLTIIGDRNRLRQLLLNLSDNAVKYNVAGGKVALALFRRDQRAELKITNSGPGIAPERQARVFDPFFRGDASHNNDVEGSGLGLSIARWIVSAHGGAITFDSKPGRQTTVTVRLPLASE